MSELEYQIRHFHGFLWASGGAFNDFYIHQIDECCWMKGGWPIDARANGGRHYRGDCVDQNFDNYSVEYTFDDGAKLFYYGRSINGCFDTYSSFVHGTKGWLSVLWPRSSPSGCRTFKGQNMTKENLLWAGPKRVQSLPTRVERPDCGHPRGQAVQRSRARRRGERGFLDGPHGRPHRADHHPQANDGLPA